MSEKSEGEKSVGVVYLASELPPCYPITTAARSQGHGARTPLS